MASIHSKKSKNGKKTYYVVVSLRTKVKWIRAGTLSDAKLLKKEIESLAESQQLEKLGITTRDKRIDASAASRRGMEREMVTKSIAGTKSRVKLLIENKNNERENIIAMGNGNQSDISIGKDRISCQYLIF